MSKKKNKQIKQVLGLVILLICIAVSIFSAEKQKEKVTDIAQKPSYFDINTIPEYIDEIYITLNNNIPYFEKNEYTKEAFETYSKLDKLGRCGVAYANICKEIMPKEERGDISKVQPTGWEQVKYNGKYLYNRCHLIGHQLAGENANEQNLITGTRTFNVNRNATI